MMSDDERWSNSSPLQGICQSQKEREDICIFDTGNKKSCVSLNRPAEGETKRGKRADCRWARCQQINVRSVALRAERSPFCCCLAPRPETVLLQGETKSSTSAPPPPLHFSAVGLSTSLTFLGRKCFHPCSGRPTPPRRRITIKQKTRRNY